MIVARFGAIAVMLLALLACTSTPEPPPSHVQVVQPKPH
jgi:hypothetical protein